MRKDLAIAKRMATELKYRFSKPGEIALAFLAE
jgi:hypothetical protein